MKKLGYLGLPTVSHDLYSMKITLMRPLEEGGRPLGLTDPMHLTTIHPRRAIFHTTFVIEISLSLAHRPPVFVIRDLSARVDAIVRTLRDLTILQIGL